jgi:uncharacterized Ntn-hydrolase superfamily protein
MAREALRMHARAVLGGAALLAASAGYAQEPTSWGGTLSFNTFSIAALDPATGETGVAVTTRVACVGNAVPHVRAGLGALATQATTRVEYGPEVFAALAEKVEPQEALARAVAADPQSAQRQVGVIDATGRTAQHTGAEAKPWAGHRAGTNYATQGNFLAGPQVVEAVAKSFESTASSGRHLADRLIEALAAGHAVGGDARKGRSQSAAVMVADPRPGRARGRDQISTNINVCEHPEPVGELRRVYDAVSETIGFRTLQQFTGSDVWQLKLMLHALGHYRAGTPKLERDAGANVYGPDAVEAVDTFRRNEGLSTPAVGSPAGLVDRETVDRLWAALEKVGKAEAVRREVREVAVVRR